MAQLANKQLDFMKDCTIAIMSTSALLLTLVLGFIAQRTPPLQKLDVGLASSALYWAIGLDVAEFIFLFPVKNEKKISRLAYGIFGAQSALFIIGLGFLYWAIVGALG